MVLKRILWNLHEIFCIIKMHFSCIKHNQFEKFKKLFLLKLNELFNCYFFQTGSTKVPKIILGNWTSGFQIWSNYDVFESPNLNKNFDTKFIQIEALFPKENPMERRSTFHPFRRSIESPQKKSAQQLQPFWLAAPVKKARGRG